MYLYINNMIYSAQFTFQVSELSTLILHTQFELEFG